MMDAGRPAAFFAIAVLGAVLLVGLLVILRVLGRRVAIEEAEEVLRAEFERDEGASESGSDEALSSDEVERRGESVKSSEVAGRAFRS